MLDCEVVTLLVEVHDYNHAQSPRPLKHEGDQRSLWPSGFDVRWDHASGSEKS
ncbi:hypothetical protein K443DRAFT_679465 [Laccaria amethystina LaAM-08-1]|jgi:hypothetical protein|uniref:Uncharacterized protein n=1 Tax=Laccaria amethystina LaAM-08-1 TaxID=1095629 RepID=A0A0C9XVY5_9AGAR|nr:hypothetical protein K443DRAFT_679465 [Laccaria amethystina LaAM-08-1]